MKWVVDRIGEEKVWYSKDVIDKIKEIAEDIVQNDCYENSDSKAQKILEIINKEDGNAYT